MLSALARASVRRVTGGGVRSSGRVCYQIQRVSFNKESQQDTNTTSSFHVPFRRLFATAVKPAAKRTRATASTKKAAPKKAAPKKAAKKVVKKPTKKAVKAKPKPKPKPVKKVPSEATLANRAKAAESAKLRELKEKALYNKEPARLPHNAWMVYFSEVSKEALKGSSSPTTIISTVIKDAAEKYKNMSTAEREELNHTANTNARANEVTYKKWIESFSPDVIRQANLARSNLRRLLKASTKEGGKIYVTATSLKSLVDDRTVKRAQSAYVLFVTGRWASGDFHGITIPDASKRMAEEWKALPASEKKDFEDQAKTDANRYFQEFSTVYGHEPVVSSP